MDTYTCDKCKETFIKGWTDEEAFAEMEEIFGYHDPEICDIFCDDCYKIIMGLEEYGNKS